MSTPTLIEVTNHLREHYSLSMAELLTIMRTPMHPAGLRDEFAGRALSGMLATPHSWPQQDADEFAEAAYRFADAMLEARNANR